MFFFLVPWFQDPLMIDKDGNTLVHLAARRGQTEIVRYFIGLANPRIPELCAVHVILEMF